MNYSQQASFMGEWARMTQAERQRINQLVFEREPESLDPNEYPAVLAAIDAHINKNAKKPGMKRICDMSVRTVYFDGGGVGHHTISAIDGKIIIADDGDFILTQDKDVVLYNALREIVSEPIPKVGDTVQCLEWGKYNALDWHMSRVGKNFIVASLDTYPDGTPTVRFANDYIQWAANYLRILKQA